jgi:hypothetical protein
MNSKAIKNILEYKPLQKINEKNGQVETCVVIGLVMFITPTKWTNIVKFNGSFSFSYIFRIQVAIPRFKMVSLSVKPACNTAKHSRSWMLLVFVLAFRGFFIFVVKKLASQNYCWYNWNLWRVSHGKYYFADLRMTFRQNFFLRDWSRNKFGIGLG